MSSARGLAAAYHGLDDRPLEISLVVRLAQGGPEGKRRRQAAGIKSRGDDEGNFLEPQRVGHLVSGNSSQAGIQDNDLERPIFDDA